MDYYISITNRCNLNCTYCYEKKLNTVMGSLDEQTADAVTDFIKKSGRTGIINYFGGEPLLGKEMIRYITERTSAGGYFITTNGTLLDEKFVKWCAENGVKINVSHDGADLSERGISPDLLNEKIKMLMKYQRDTLVQLVYTEKSLPTLPDNIRYFRDLGIRNISAVMEERTAPSDPDAFGEVLMKAWHEASEITGVNILELTEKIIKIKEGTQNSCEVCRKKMYINWDGKIYPCLQFQNRPEFCCGDVFTGLDTERTEAEHLDFSLFPVECEGCEIIKYCDNYCACRKMATSGTLGAVSEASCLEQQILTMTALETIERYAKFCSP